MPKRRLFSSKKGTFQPAPAPAETEAVEDLSVMYRGEMRPVKDIIKQLDWYLERYEGRRAKQ